MKFITPYTYKSSPGETNSGEILVEKAGYVSAEQRIIAIMLAGRRLIESRGVQYDYAPDDDLDDDRYDITREPGYDVADATQEVLRIQQRFASKKGESANIESPKLQSESEPEPAT